MEKLYKALFDGQPGDKVYFKSNFSIRNVVTLFRWVTYGLLIGDLIDFVTDEDPFFQEFIKQDPPDVKWEYYKGDAYYTLFEDQKPVNKYGPNKTDIFYETKLYRSLRLVPEVNIQEFLKINNTIYSIFDRSVMSDFMNQKNNEYFKRFGEEYKKEMHDTVQETIYDLFVNTVDEKGSLFKIYDSLPKDKDFLQRQSELWTEIILNEPKTNIEKSMLDYYYEVNKIYGSSYTKEQLEEYFKQKWYFEARRFIHQMQGETLKTRTGHRRLTKTDLVANLTVVENINEIPDEIQSYVKEFDIMESFNLITTGARAVFDLVFFGLKNNVYLYYLGKYYFLDLTFVSDVAYLYLLSSARYKFISDRNAILRKFDDDDVNDTNVFEYFQKKQEQFYSVIIPLKHLFYILISGTGLTLKWIWLKLTRNTKFRDILHSSFSPALGDSDYQHYGWFNDIKTIEKLTEEIEVLEMNPKFSRVERVEITDINEYLTKGIQMIDEFFLMFKSVIKMIQNENTHVNSLSRGIKRLRKQATETVKYLFIDVKGFRYASTDDFEIVIPLGLDCVEPKQYVLDHFAVDADTLKDDVFNRFYPKFVYFNRVYKMIDSFVHFHVNIKNVKDVEDLVKQTSNLFEYKPIQTMFPKIVNKDRKFLILNYLGTVLKTMVNDVIHLDIYNGEQWLVDYYKKEHIETSFIYSVMMLQLKCFIMDTYWKGKDAYLNLFFRESFIVNREDDIIKKVYEAVKDDLNSYIEIEIENDNEIADDLLYIKQHAL